MDKDWLIGGGEMGALIRATDWTHTPLGPRERWSQSLRTAVSLVVETRLPMLLLWGHDLLMLYNDALRWLASDRHPRALGRSTREIWPELWDFNAPIFAAVLERGESVYLEDELFPVFRNGQREDAYFTLCYSPVRDEDGRVAGSLVTLLETSRLRAEQERFNAFMRHSPTIAWVKDEAGRYAYLNAAYERTFGVRLEDWRGKTDFDVWPEDVAREFRDKDLEVLRGGNAIDLIEESRDAQGCARAWLDCKFPFRDAAGRVYVGGVGIDITERLRIEEALRESERTQRLIAQAGEIAASSRGTDNLVEAIGERIAQELGVSRCGFARVDTESCEAEVLRDYHGGLPSITRVFRVADPPKGWQEEGVAGRTKVVEDVATDPRTAAHYSTFFAPLQVRAYVTVPLHRDGRWVASFWATHHEPRRWAASEIQTMNLIADRLWAMIERKRAEEALARANDQLRETDRRKNEFLAVLSHELRNPLASIRNSVYVLERATPGGEQANRARQVIDRQAQHLTRLIEDLLDITRITFGKITLQRERIDLNVLAQRAAEDHRGMFTRNGIELEVRAAGEPLWVDGDPTRLAQVIGNLLQNASRFTPHGGTTVLVVEAGARGAIVRVRDSGIGMSAATAAHVFEPFVQAAQTLERRQGGLGLGLALVKRLIEMHDGTVAARSDGEGKGSELTVTLPLQTPVTPGPTPVSTAGRLSTGRRVLVIEDNPDAAESLREALELGDHEVAIAATGPDGMHMVHIFRPHVVFCDIGLPGMDGHAVARALRADEDVAIRSTFLVALSGYASPEDVERSMDAGFDRHLAKPPAIEALERLIAEAPVH